MGHEAADMTIERARSLLMGETAEPALANGAASGDGQEDGVVAGPASGRRPSAAAVEPDSGSHGARADELASDGARSYDDGSVGLGVDIVEVERMKRILERTPSFAERVFSPAECAYCDSKSNRATHYALRFAAKEAVVKALGTGFANGIGVRDIEVERAKNGRPSAKLSGRALEIAESQGVRDLSISLSYTHTDAVACAMAVTDASVRASKKRKDPMEELTKQFKEVRGMLDEL